MKRIFITLLLCFFAFACCAIPTLANEKLDNLKSIYEKEMAKIDAQYESDTKGIHKIYQERLNAALEKATNKGDLKLYAKIETEKKRFDKEKTIPEGSSVAEHIEKAKAKKNLSILNLSKKYTAGLNGLKISMMKAKNIEGAKQVQAEIDKVTFGAAVIESSAPASKLESKSSLGNLGEGLVLHYDFEKYENGKVSDKSGNGNDSEADGKWMPFYKSRRGIFKSEKDLCFTSDMPNTLLPYTISGWFLSSGNNLAYGGHAGHSVGLRLRCLHTKTIGIFVSRTPRWAFPKKIEAPTDRWFHIAFAADKSGTKLYIDGSEKDFGTKRTALPMSRLGLNGYNDDIMIWNRALSDDEIKQVYKMTGGK